MVGVSVAVGAGGVFVAVGVSVAVGADVVFVIVGVTVRGIVAVTVGVDAGGTDEAL